MGLFSSICSAVSSAFSSACSALSSVFSGVASMASGVLSLARVLPLPPQIEAFFLAVKLIDVVCKALGIIETDESTEEMGDRALQAEEAGIRPEDYPTYKEYVAAIRNFELDPEKTEKYKPEEKMAAGLSVEYWGLEERFGTGAGDLLTHMVKDSYQGGSFFNEERVTRFLDKVESPADVAKYFSNTLSPSDNARVEGKLVDAEKSLNPNKDIGDVYRDLYAKRD